VGYAGVGRCGLNGLPSFPAGSTFFGKYGEFSSPFWSSVLTHPPRLLSENKSRDRSENTSHSLPWMPSENKSGDLSENPSKYPLLLISENSIVNVLPTLPNL